MKLIDKSALVAEIEKLRAKWFGINNDFADGQKGALTDVLSLLDTLEVKEVDISSVSENLAEAYEYLDYTSIGNLAHNKPMVSARLKKAIQSLFNARLFELTHDEKYRMKSLGLKAQKGELIW